MGRLWLDGVYIIFICVFFICICIFVYLYLNMDLDPEEQIKDRQKYRGPDMAGQIKKVTIIVGVWPF